MNMYRLDILLEAARFFATEDGAIEMLEFDLRDMQSLIDKAKPEDIKEVSYNTFVSVISGLTACVSQVVDAILSKYEEIRTADWSALFKSKCSGFYSEYFLKSKSSYQYILNHI